MSPPVAASPSVSLNGNGPAQLKTAFLGLTIGSIGVVYGDIGTSPLYALREAVLASIEPGGEVNRAAVFGVLSLILWALIVTVTLKYVIVLLRADNNGEGGTLALMALAQRVLRKGANAIVLCGIISAALFYGDALITPALSVLSAIEALKIATPAFNPYIVSLTVAILVSVFAGQSRGTARVAAFFGPIMVVWFATIAITGLVNIHDDPHVLAAINPFYGVRFLAEHGHVGLVTLGLVFLAVTGGEALYADLGHFGRRPIQTAWLFLVFPALLLNYFGQGALVLADESAIENPFYRMMPESLLMPMIVLATVATVIASQAVITGAYSLVAQAIQLGLLPRLAIRHTSAERHGQIYIPRVTVALLAGVLLLVGLFRTSSALASAYGIAVTTTMVVDGILGLLVVWKLWNWKLWQAALLVAPLVFVDAVFFSADLLKIFDGAWAPIAFGSSMVLIILTWRRGTGILAQKTRRTEVPLETLVRSLQRKPPHVVPGTAVFLTSDPDSAPTSLLHNLKHNKVLHEHNVILTIVTADTPRVSDQERVRITEVSPLFSKVSLKFGYMESPNVPKALAIARKLGWHFDIMSTSFFLSRRSLKPAAHSGMPRWQDRLFIMLAKSASDATDFFQIPTGRVVEVGTQVTV